MRKKKIYKRAYIDYKQLERELNKKVGEVNDLKVMQEYMKKTYNINITKVEDKCFVFNYKDMSLIITNNNPRELCQLFEVIMIYDEKGNVIKIIDFNDLEKEILKYE